MNTIPTKSKEYIKKPATHKTPEQQRCRNLEHQVKLLAEQLTTAADIIKERDEQIATLLQIPKDLHRKPILSSTGTQTDATEIESSIQKYNESERKCAELEAQCEKLTNQVTAMEKFLADYGLKWVGDGADEPENSVPTEGELTKNYFKPDIDKTIELIEDLNKQAREPQIVHTSSGAKFQSSDVIRLTFYSNGIQLEDQEFREYYELSVQNFFQDLQDGYYPAELKEEYPEGVVFKVLDQRSVEYSSFTGNKLTPFSGRGYRLGGNGKRRHGTHKKSTYKTDKAPTIDYKKLGAIPKTKQSIIKDKMKINKKPLGKKLRKTPSNSDMNLVTIGTLASFHKIEANWEGVPKQIKNSIIIFEAEIEPEVVAKSKKCKSEKPYEEYLIHDHKCSKDTGERQLHRIWVLNERTSPEQLLVKIIPPDRLDFYESYLLPNQPIQALWQLLRKSKLQYSAGEPLPRKPSVTLSKLKSKDKLVTKRIHRVRKRVATPG